MWQSKYEMDISVIYRDLQENLLVLGSEMGRKNRKGEVEVDV